MPSKRKESAESIATPAQPRYRTVHTWKRIHFTYSDGLRKLTPNDTIAGLVDDVIGICLGSPEFVDAIDVKRHIFLLSALKDWQTHGDFSSSSDWGKRVPSGDLPIYTLGRVLGDWVLSHFKRDLQLQAHYALDTAMFLERIAYGYQGDSQGPRSDNWYTSSLINGDEPSRRELELPTYKHKFTRSIDLIVLAKVPEGCDVIAHGGTPDGSSERIVRLASGTEFEFSVRRCHLSNDLAMMNSVLSVYPDPDSQRLNISSDFRLNGFILHADRRENYIVSDWAESRWTFGLPPSWIIGQVVKGRDRLSAIIPACSWELDEQI